MEIWYDNYVSDIYVYGHEIWLKANIIDFPAKKNKKIKAEIKQFAWMYIILNSIFWSLYM